VTSPRVMLRRTFSALAVRNFRLYFGGQVISVSGTWMQRVAQSWLVLELTGSGAAVGGVTAFQFLPILLVAPMGGLIADRMDKRRVLYVSQSLAGLIALTLGLLVLTDRVELWMVYALALALGVVGSFDNPARNAFVMEMVGRSRLTNAVGLNSVLVNSARIIGPAVGGLLIVTVGIGICFIINAFSYLALIGALLLMREREIERSEPEPRRRGQLREALAYVWREPVLRVPLVMMGVVGLFVYEFEVILPLLARFTFGGDADVFGDHVRRHGTGGGAGRVLHRHPGRATGPDPDLDGLRRGSRGGGHRHHAQPVDGADDAGGGRSDDHRVPDPRQRRHAVAFRPRDAGKGDGPAGGGSARLPPDRRPDRGLDRRALRPPFRPRPGSGGGAGGGGLGPPLGQHLRQNANLRFGCTEVVQNSLENATLRRDAVPARTGLDL
jgi:MFS family permease